MKGIVKKVFRRINIVLSTVWSRIKWRNMLSFNGLFRKRRDTQIIINESSRIRLGKDITFQRNVSLSSCGGGILCVGNDVHFNRNCIVVCRHSIDIGNDVLFGPGVTIYDHDHIFSEDGVFPGFKLGSVVIEDGCWIGANVTILRDTHIGRNSVIGAGTVVKGTIPACSLAMGQREMSISPICK